MRGFGTFAQSAYARAVACEYRQRGAVEPYRAALLHVVTGDDIEDGGLAAAVWPDQSMHLTWSGSRGRDRRSLCTPPKLSATCSSVKVPVSRGHAEQLLEQIRSRDDRAAACERVGGS